MGRVQPTTRSSGAVALMNRAVICFVLAAVAMPLQAQPVVKITSLRPEWVQRGATSVVVLEGEELSNVTGFLFSDEKGLSATHAPPTVRSASLEGSRGGIVSADGEENRLRVSVRVESESALGPRELRVVTAAGVSNPVTLNVGHLIELIEHSPNRSLEEAQAIELPAGINGVISEAAEADFFRFEARKGQRLIFDVLAFRAGSPLDASLALLDREGKELTRSEDTGGLDPLIDFTAPEDGRYVLQLRDFRYQGGKAFKYRIVAGELPYLDSVFPLGGQRGKPVEVALRGRNLDGLEKLKVRVEATAPLGPQEIRAHTSRGTSNPVFFEVGDLVEFTESEPNNGTNAANTVTIPSTINGRMGGEKDSDHFRFKAAKGQTLIVDVVASRFGSPLDAVIALTDSNGKLLQQNDDATGADARIEQNFSEEGEYLVKVRDLLDRGGDDFGYRLAIRPPRPDFSVRFFPDVPRLYRGSCALLNVEVVRQGGFGGAVEVRLEGLPEGVAGLPLLVPPDNAVSPRMVLEARGDATPGVHKFRVVADAMVGGSRVSREGTPLSEGQPVREAFLTILERPPFTLEPITLGARTDQGQSAVAEVNVRRHDGFSGEIQVTAEGFSSGKEALAKNVDVEATTLKGNEGRARLNLKAKQDSETGTRMIVFKGESKVNGQTITQFSRAIPLTVDLLPFTLASSLPRLSVTALAPEKKSPASEAEFVIKANRRGWFTDDIQLSVEGLPEGIAINATNLARGSAEAAYKIVASDKAVVGTNASLVIVGTTTVNGKTHSFRTPGIQLTVNPAEETAQVAATGEGTK